MPLCGSCVATPFYFCYCYLTLLTYLQHTYLVTYLDVGLTLCNALLHALLVPRRLQQYRYVLSPVTVCDGACNRI